MKLKFRALDKRDMAALEQELVARFGAVWFSHERDDPAHSWEVTCRLGADATEGEMQRVIRAHRCQFESIDPSI